MQLAALPQRCVCHGVAEKSGFAAWHAILVSLCESLNGFPGFSGGLGPP